MRVGEGRTALKRTMLTHCCYTYENWVGSGSATMTLKTDGYSVAWTGSTQFVGGVIGIRALLAS
jgi:hypothetical protein